MMADDFWMFQRIHFNLIRSGDEPWAGDYTQGTVSTNPLQSNPKWFLHNPHTDLVKMFQRIHFNLIRSGRDDDDPYRFMG